MTTYADLREAHAKGFNSASDEAWDHNPICLGDGHAWPCDTAKALDLVEKMRGDVHHHVNPSIGLLRHDFQSATGADPFDVEEDSEWGMRPLDITHSRIISTVLALQAATDAADAALGEKPMREQIADLHAQIAADRAASTDTENGPTS